MERVTAPDWYITSSDIANDLEALHYAALWFEDKPGKVPEMDVQIYFYRTGGVGPKFSGSRGRLFPDWSF